MGRRRIRRWEALWALVALAVLSTVAARTTTRTEFVDRAGRVVDPAVAEQLQDRPGAPDARGAVPGSRGPGQAALECAAGRNGGETDVGVTATTIKLGATVVETGIGRAFLADVRYAMIAVANKVNAAGGICGRRLELVLKDDGWEANRGFTFIQNLVEDTKVFALAVVPSSEGLRAAKDYIVAKRVPVVGTDGMLISQYRNPYIWPVASSTITAMHIMAKEAHGRGATQFGIVYDSNYRFGIEGAYAVNAAVKRITGRDIPGYANPLSGSAQCVQRFCGIQTGNPSYGPEIQEFRSSCLQDQPPCDFVVYLLEPDTARRWMSGGGPRASEITEGGNRPGGIGAPQPLFNRGFAVGCGERCDGMWVWTGYTPPIEPFTNDPAVAGYVGDLGRTNAQADPNNSFVEGGYVGMNLLVQALVRLGPNVTREGLRAVLDSTRLEVGLTRPLAWAAENHFANRCMMGFSIQARPSFAGWRQETGWLCDADVALDIPAGE